MKNPADARAVRSRSRILDAAVGLMVEGGIDGVNVKAVAERADVQRSTVYNHWRERSDLILAAIEHLAETEAEVDGPERADDGLEQIATVVRRLGRNLGTDWGAVAASLAAAAEHDEDLAEAHRTFVRGAREDLAELIAQQVEAGTLRADIDPAWAVRILVGPLYYERLVMHRHLTKTEIDAHIDATIGGWLT